MCQTVIMNDPKKKDPDDPLRIPLDFEEVSAELMKIKPVENTDLRKSLPLEKAKLKQLAQSHRSICSISWMTLNRHPAEGCLCLYFEHTHRLDTL